MNGKTLTFGKMKNLILLLLLTTNTLFAELRTIAIVGHPVEERVEGVIHIKGYTYSLLSNIENEQIVEVSLKALLEKLPKVSNAGSAVWVAIQSDRALPLNELSQIMEAMSKNIYLELIYLEGGLQNQESGAKILRDYGVLSKSPDFNKTKVEKEEADRRPTAK